MWRQVQHIGEKLQEFAVRPEILGRSCDLDPQRPVPETQYLIPLRTRLNTDLETHEASLFMGPQRHASGARGPKTAEPIRSSVAPSSIATE